MIQTSCGGKNGKLKDTIEVSALWSISITGRTGLQNGGGGGHVKFYPYEEGG